VSGEPVEDVIVRLFDCPDRVLARRQLRDLGEAGDLLLRWGAMLPGETLTSIACRSCGDDHPVDLEFDAMSSTWRHYCGAVGFVAIDNEDLVTFRLHLDWLFVRLGELLQLRRPDRACLVDGVMWRLGVARADQRFWTAVLARDVVDHLDPILEQLQRAGGDHGGLVLTSSANLPFRVPLPNGYRWLPLRDLLDADDNGLRIQQGAIRRALAGVLARAVVERPPGRPGVEGVVLGEFRRRSHVGQTEPTLRAEAAALQSWLLTNDPDSGGRSLGTIENLIRSGHAAWRRGNPRATT
jgi:hypothetical protein